MACVENLSGDEYSKVASIYEDLEYLRTENSELGRQAMSEERSNGDDDLDVGGMDDNLKAKILAQLPFRSFVRISSSLSKTWRLIVDSEWFRRELQNGSSSWESYCPVLMNDRRELVGYESSLNHWHRLPTHSYIESALKGWCLRAGVGSLFCWTTVKPIWNEAAAVYVSITNPFTRSLRKLPDRPVMSNPILVHMDLDGNEDYKVILGNLIHFGRFPYLFSIRVQIFNSVDESWIVEDYISAQTTRVLDESDVESTFMNGVLYVLFQPKIFEPRGYGLTMISLDVNKKVWREFPLRMQAVNEDGRPRDRPLVLHAIHGFSLCVCGSHVMIVIDYKGTVGDIRSFEADGDTRDTLSVFQLDVDHGLAVEVSRGPNDPLQSGFGNRSAVYCFNTGPSIPRFSTVVAHDDRIYLGYSSWGTPLMLLVYNVGSRLWHKIHSVPGGSPPFDMMTPFSYRPRLNALLDIGFLSSVVSQS